MCPVQLEGVCRQPNGWKLPEGVRYFRREEVVPDPDMVVLTPVGFTLSV